MVTQRLPDIAGHVLGRSKDAVEDAVLGQPLHRGLWPDTGGGLNGVGSPFYSYGAVGNDRQPDGDAPLNRLSDAWAWEIDRTTMGNGLAALTATPGRRVFRTPHKR